MIMIDKTNKLSLWLSSNGFAKEASEIDNFAVENAIEQILKPGFDILGHGTTISNAKSIIENGFSLQAHALSSTFLTMKKDDNPSIRSQLKWWPYGETSQYGEGIGVAIMRIPKDMIYEIEPRKLTEMVSIPAESSEKTFMEDPELGKLRTGSRKESNTIPSYFFFAVWNQEEAVLELNQQYNESKILEHLNLNETAIEEKAPESLPIFSIPSEGEDFDDEVW